jgi:lipopolysaccharide biosynthesis glycosyltransferase
MAEIIHIVAGTDDNYAQHLGVMLTSLLVNNSFSKIFIHVLYEKLQKNNVDNITEIVRVHNQQIEFLKVNISKISKYLKTTHHISKAAYFKILTPKLIKKGIKKVLYLDCDLIILGEIKNLWRTDISQYYLGAVSDPTSERYYDLGIPKSSGYFNTGVLLFNIPKWKQSKMPDKVINFIKNNQNKILLWDQDALNANLYDKWLGINPKYNFQSAMYGTRIVRNPIIVHYSSSSKPWQFRNNHPLRNKYWEYLRLTPWKNYRPRDFTLKSIVLHFTPLKAELLLRKVYDFISHLFL